MNTAHCTSRTLVLGLGSSGEAAARLLVSLGAMVTVLDTGNTATLKQRAANLCASGIACVLGEEAERFLRTAGRIDFAVLSPGIDPTVPLVRGVMERGITLIGELELAYRHCPWPVIAITGTNGKTTTTELTAAMLCGSSVRTVACGNIGRPFSDVVLENPPLDVVTLEVSSFQLETIRSFRPRISAWLNFSADHLDRYPSIESYFAAKKRIFENQSEEDTAVINASLNVGALRPRITRFSATAKDADFSLHNGTEIHFKGSKVLDLCESHFRGTHNAENFMAALGIGLAWGLSFETMSPPLLSCRPAAHRCEHIAERDGVTYVNDSKSTNADSLEKALLSVRPPVVLIAGGKEKGFAFDGLRDLLMSRVRTAILIGETRQRMRQNWEGVPMIECETLKDAVRAAKRLAQEGDTVLLSPGTSSFDMFKDYADRGNQFRELVTNDDTL